MTLIVANVTPGGVWLTADMRVTDPSSAIAPGFLGAALKLVLVNPMLCIGYAGAVGVALAAIRHVKTEEMAPAAVVDHLLRIHLETSNAADFIIAGLEPSVLVEVKGGHARPCESTWIGDLQAFSRFQSLYHGEHMPPPTEGLDPDYVAGLDIAVKMNDAMQDLVLADSLPDGPDRSDALVGEASVTVGPSVPDGLFEYHPYASYNGPFATSIPVDRPLVSTEQGSFTFSFLAPEEPGIAAVGIHFIEGRLGLLYAPLAPAPGGLPVRFFPVDLDEFVEGVKTSFGVDLRSVEHPGPWAETP